MKKRETRQAKRVSAHLKHSRKGEKRKRDEDSTPHFCDSTADIVRNARIARSPQASFGTKPFLQCNARVAFGTGYSYLMRLYRYVIIARLETNVNPFCVFSFIKSKKYEKKKSHFQKKEKPFPKNA